MQDKKIKIIYFSLRDSESKALELSQRNFVAMLSVLELGAMGKRLRTIEARVVGLEREDDDLRIIANLPKVDSDAREVGIGGNEDNALSAAYSDQRISSKVSSYQSVLEEMERRVDLTLASRTAIREKLEENREMMKHIPSIRPLLGGRLNDRYGMRFHPIISRLQRHEGVDIAAPQGTEVFAAAAGVVTKSVTKYQRNRSYGKHIIIDHGYGLSTLYGHLSRILVREGQKIDRWTPIGLVGETGRATGPHLHYEVRKGGQPQDPMSYILDVNSVD
jgi:murein DD-endopeptidase MepM/ murein hydrolase activator NlpD